MYRTGVTGMRGTRFGRVYLLPTPPYRFLGKIHILVHPCLRYRQFVVFSRGYRIFVGRLECSLWTVAPWRGIVVLLWVGCGRGRDWGVSARATSEDVHDLVDWSRQGRRGQREIERRTGFVTVTLRTTSLTRPRDVGVCGCRPGHTSRG